MADPIRRIRLAARRGMLAAGFELERKVVLLISQPGKGRVYEKYKPRRTHVASTPGAPPASDTGRLKQSIRTVDQSFGNRIKVRVGTNVEYAEPLEFGRRNAAARPFFRPAVGLTRLARERAMLRELRRL